MRLRGGERRSQVEPQEILGAAEEADRDDVPVANQERSPALPASRRLSRASGIPGAHAGRQRPERLSLGDEQACEERDPGRERHADGEQGEPARRANAGKNGDAERRRGHSENEEPEEVERPVGRGRRRLVEEPLGAAYTTDPAVREVCLSLIVYLADQLLFKAILPAGHQLILGVVLVAVVILAPHGLMGSLTRKPTPTTAGGHDAEA